MSGVLGPTSGVLYSWGLNRNTNSGKIREFTNICPQFDTLWTELTILDHIKLITRLKGLQLDKDNTEAKERQFAYDLLRNVNLHDSLEVKIKNLSGGMRRRVSIV